MSQYASTPTIGKIIDAAVEAFNGRYGIIAHDRRTIDAARLVEPAEIWSVRPYSYYKKAVTAFGAEFDPQGTKDILGIDDAALEKASSSVKSLLGRNDKDTVRVANDIERHLGIAPKPIVTKTDFEKYAAQFGHNGENVSSGAVFSEKKALEETPVATPKALEGPGRPAPAKQIVTATPPSRSFNTAAPQSKPKATVKAVQHKIEFMPLAKIACSVFDEMTQAHITYDDLRHPRGGRITSHLRQLIFYSAHCILPSDGHTLQEMGKKIDRIAVTVHQAVDKVSSDVATEDEFTMRFMEKMCERINLKEQQKEALLTGSKKRFKSWKDLDDAVSRQPSSPAPEHP